MLFAGLAIRAFVLKRQRSAIVLGIAAVVCGVWYQTTDDVPTEFIPFLPHVTTLLVLVFATQRLRPPAADGRVYRRGGGLSLARPQPRSTGTRSAPRRARWSTRPTPRTRTCTSAPPRWSTTGASSRGCNVENASYGLTLCAECGLVSALRATGGGRLVALAVVAGDGAYLAPCGRCRQVLYEFGGPDLLVDTGATARPTTLGELLPGAFGPDDVASRSD